jgi:hypothetical protein
MLFASAVLVLLAGAATVLPFSHLSQNGAFVSTRGLAADLGAASGGLAVVATAALWVDRKFDDEQADG